jgi:DNA-binding transcriptional ArsR family regulator
MLKVLNALAEPNRLAIIKLLQDRPHAVGEIVAQLGLLQPQVSKHLRVLEDAGLVEVQPLANKRIYKLRPEPFQELDVWLHSFRKIWDERFDRLDAYLQELQSAGKNPDQPE